MSASEDNDAGRLAVASAAEGPGTEQFDFRTALTGRDDGQSFVSFPSGHLIYSQTDPADAAFYVESGHVKIAAVTPSGKEAVVAIRRPGEFFGTRGLVGKRTGFAPIPISPWRSQPISSIKACATNQTSWIT